jgi:hypothetical protein
MPTELKPPVIPIALLIFGKKIDMTHVAEQNIVVHIKLLI